MDATDMQINNNGGTNGVIQAAAVVDATNTTSGKDSPAADPTPAVSSDTVTLSAAARKLADGIEQLNEAMAGLPSPSAAPATQPRAGDAKKKHFTSQLAMLDVDAMRLIRDKLRSQNLQVKDVTPTEQDLKSDKADETAIQK